jgi:hypoxanthine phosphoribosyltransferase
MIQLHDKQFVPFLSAQEIPRNRKMTAQVEADFKDEVPVFIGF